MLSWILNDVHWPKVERLKHRALFWPERPFQLVILYFDFIAKFDFINLEKGLYYTVLNLMYIKHVICTKLPEDNTVKVSITLWTSTLSSSILAPSSSKIILNYHNNQNEHHHHLLYIIGIIIIIEINIIIINMNNIIYSTLSPCNHHHYEHGPLAWLHRWQHQALVWLSWNYIRISKRYEKWIEHGHNWPLNSLTLYTRFWIDSYDQWSKSVGYLWIHWSFRKLYSFQDLTVHVKKVKFEENWLRKCVSLSFRNHNSCA